MGGRQLAAFSPRGPDRADHVQWYSKVAGFVPSAGPCQGLTLHQRAAGVRGRPRAACLLLPPARHLLPLGDLLGQAAGILHILRMAWPASCRCHLPLTLPACSPGEDPAPGPAAPVQEARCLSPIPGMASLPAPSFLPGFPLLTGIASCPGPLSGSLALSVCLILGLLYLWSLFLGRYVCLFRDLYLSDSSLSLGAPYVFLGLSVSRLQSLSELSAHPPSVLAASLGILCLWASLGFSLALPLLLFGWTCCPHASLPAPPCAYQVFYSFKTVGSCQAPGLLLPSWGVLGGCPGRGVPSCSLTN